MSMQSVLGTDTATDARAPQVLGMTSHGTLERNRATAQTHEARAKLKFIQQCTGARVANTADVTNH